MQKFSKLSSPDEKKNNSRAVYETLSDFFFDQAILVTTVFSEISDGGTTSTTYQGASRVTDTSEGRYLDVGKRSRFRTSFYASNPDSLDAYILSPAVYDSFSSLNTISSMNILRSYVGIRILNGSIYAVVKESGKTEKRYPTNFSFSGTGDSDTYTLEMIHNVTSTEIYINDEPVGTYPSDMQSGFNSTKTVLPLLAPGRSTDGSNINLTLEHFQFIQDR